MCRRLHAYVAKAAKATTNKDAETLERLAELLVSDVSVSQQWCAGDCRNEARDFIDNLYEMSDTLLKPLWPKGAAGKNLFKAGQKLAGHGQ